MRLPTVWSCFVLSLFCYARLSEAALPAPSGLRLVSRSPTSITIAWQGVLASGTDTLSVYRVSYKTTAASAVASTVTPDAANNFVTITGLTPCTVYQITVAGVDNVATPNTPVLGPFSLPLFISTFAAAPTSAPTAISLSSSTSTSAILQLTDANNAACPTGATSSCGSYYYRVTLKNSAGAIVTSAVTASFYVSFVGLTSGATYTPEVTVIEMTSNQAGPVYTGTAITISTTAATLPALSNLLQNPFAAYTISWAQLYASKQVGVDYYQECSSVSQPSSQTIEAYASRSYTPTTLTSCTRYSVVAYSKTNGLPSPSMLLHVRSSLATAASSVAGSSSDPSQIHVVITDVDRAADCDRHRFIYKIEIVDQASVANPKPALLTAWTNSLNYVFKLPSGFTTVYSTVATFGIRVTAGTFNGISITVAASDVSAATGVTPASAAATLPAAPTQVTATVLNEQWIQVSWSNPTGATATATQWELIIVDMNNGITYSFDVSPVTLTTVNQLFRMSHCSTYMLKMRGVVVDASSNRLVGADSNSVQFNSPGLTPTPVTAVFLTRPDSTKNTLSVAITDPLMTIFRPTSCDSFLYVVQLWRMGAVPVRVASLLQTGLTATFNNLMSTESYAVTVNVIGINTGVISVPIYSNSIDMYSGTRPAAVSNLAAASTTASGTTLTWTAATIASPAMIDSYIVTRMSPVAGTSVSYMTKATSLVITDMLGCTDYTVYVEAVAMISTGVYVKSPSAFVTVTTLASKKALNGVYLDPITPTSAVLTIVDPGQNCPVTYSVTVNSVGAAETARTMTTRQQRLTLTGLTSGGTYKATVFVKYSDASSGASVFSNTLTLPSSLSVLGTGQQMANISVNLANGDGSELYYNPVSDMPGASRFSTFATNWCTLLQLALDNAAALLTVDTCTVQKVQSGSIQVTSAVALSRADSTVAPTLSATQLQDMIKMGAANIPSNALASIGFSLDTSVLQVATNSATRMSSIASVAIVLLTLWRAIV